LQLREGVKARARQRNDGFDARARCASRLQIG
jgi:hypothetical protein